jgi:hypothetical protein
MLSESAGDNVSLHGTMIGNIGRCDEVLHVSLGYKQLFGEGVRLPFRIFFFLPDSAFLARKLLRVVVVEEYVPQLVSNNKLSSWLPDVCLIPNILVYVKLGWIVCYVRWSLALFRTKEFNSDNTGLQDALRRELPKKIRYFKRRGVRFAEDEPNPTCV